jgi:hypothetical protein
MRTDNALLRVASERVVDALEADARAYSIAGEALAALALVLAIAGLIFVALSLGVVPT